MSWSLLVNTGVAGATTSGIDTTGCDLLVLCSNSFFPTTPTDSKGNTWILAASEVSGVRECQIWYCQAPIVGSGHTFSDGGGAQTLTVMGWSGSVASPLDQVSAGDSQSGVTTIQPGSITPAEGNELVIVSLLAESGHVTYAIDGGFTKVNDVVASGSYNAADAYLIQTSAAAANPTWTLGSGVNCAAIQVSFKAAGGGGGGGGSGKPTNHYAMMTRM